MSEVAVIALLACFVLVLASVRSVPPQHTYVVELLRRRRRALEPGVQVLVPLLESVRAKIYTGMQSGSFGPVQAITSDDLVACISTVVHHQVVDPVRATYEVFDRPKALEMATEFALRAAAGTMTLDWMRSNLDQVATQVAEVLDQKTATFGVRVIRAEITAVDRGSRSGCG